MIGIPHDEVANAHGRYQAGRWNDGPFRLCAATILFFVIGMTANVLIAGSSITSLLLAVALPLVAIAFVSGSRYAMTGLGQLREGFGTWHWVWLALFLSGLVFRVRTVDEISESTVDVWAIFRVTLMGMIALFLMLRFIARKTDWMNSLFRGMVGAMALYAIVCAISTTWSVFPAWTLYKSLEYLTDVAVIAAVVTSVRSVDEYRRLFDWIWVLYGLLILSVWFGAMLAPSIAFVPNAGSFGFELQGVMPTLSSNGVGEAGSLLGVVAFARLIWRQHAKGGTSWYCLLLMISACTLILSQARSAVVGFLSGVLIAAFCRSARLAMIGLIACALAAFVFGAAIQITHTYLLRGQDPELFHGLSGRVDWWQSAWLKILERPWLGYGAYAGSRFVVLAQLGETETSSIHNSYIEVVLGCGILGLLPLLAALAGTWWQLISVLFKSPVSSLDAQVAVEALSVLTVISARSLFSVTMIWHPAVEFLIVLGYAELLRRRRVAGQLMRQPGSTADRLYSRPVCARAP